MAREGPIRNLLFSEYDWDDDDDEDELAQRNGKETVGHSLEARGNPCSLVDKCHDPSIPLWRCESHFCCSWTLLVKHQNPLSTSISFPDDNQGPCDRITQLVIAQGKNASIFIHCLGNINWIFPTKHQVFLSFYKAWFKKCTQQLLVWFKGS